MVLKIFKGAVIFICTLTFMLLSATFIDYLISNKTLENNKDLVAVVEDIITIATIIIGAILSYVKFFKGRTFSAKANIEVDISLIKAPNNSFLHIVKFYIVNQGSVTIWNPVAKVGIRTFTELETASPSIISDIKERSFFDDSNVERSYMVDPGEKTFFIHSQYFDKSIWAVSYDIEITSTNNYTWRNSCTVANRDLNPMENGLNFTENISNLPC